MAEIVLFHHVQGATPGVHALADALRDGGHVVHVPDLLDGALPETVEAGLALMAGLDDGVVAARTERALEGLPAGLVYAGVSWGGSIAQRLAQTRPGARGALLYESFVSLSAEWAFGPWPAGVPVQVHGMARDPYFAGEGDLEAARELVDAVGPEARRGLRLRRRRAPVHGRVAAVGGSGRHRPRGRAVARAAGAHRLRRPRRRVREGTRPPRAPAPPPPPPLTPRCARRRAPRAGRSWRGPRSEQPPRPRQHPRPPPAPPSCGSP
ncbi:dienelactone hydrolase family protein [Clavibacter tessellarius]|uniref:dienelactone hydrolase family protein n=1 Tax=Clavibacter tessellarius TaxID=31965 RepID=UPI0032430EAD